MLHSFHAIMQLESRLDRAAAYRLVCICTVDLDTLIAES